MRRIAGLVITTVCLTILAHDAATGRFGAFRSVYDRFAPSGRRRTRAEAEEAFRRLLVLRSEPRRRAGSWPDRKKEDRYSLVIYNAGKDGVALCEEAVCGTDPRRRDLAMSLVSQAVIAEEPWHTYRALVRARALRQFRDIAIQNIGIFIKDANPDIDMLYTLLLREITVSVPLIQTQAEMNHPLYVWFTKHEHLLCHCMEGHEIRKSAIIEAWRSWGRDNAAGFAQSLKEYDELGRKGPFSRWMKDQEE